MLSERLDLIYSLLEPGLPVWDIGCDHGYVGFRALAEDIFPEVHFVDCSVEVIQKLHTTLAIPKVKRMVETSSAELDVRLSRAQDLPWDSIRGNVVIAGMGAKTISQIIASISPQSRPYLRLILSPQKEPELLRRTLNQYGWRTVERGEFLIKEGSRFREVIVAQQDGAPIKPYGGSIWTDSDHAEDYLNHLIRVLSVSERKKQERPDDLELLKELRRLHFPNTGDRHPN